MDLVLDFADTCVFDAVYARLIPLAVDATNSPTSNLTKMALENVATLSAWPRTHVLRQLLTLFFITLLGGNVLYFLFASMSYFFIFNHDMMRHPRFLNKQVQMEIKTSLSAIPVITLLTLPWFLGEVRGWSRLYNNVEDMWGDRLGGWGGWVYLVGVVPAFLLFTDYCIYWVHRWLHHPMLYKPLHKAHHKWIIPTPFASYAFHPVDGYLQGVPYHLFVFIFPMHRLLYLTLFVAVSFWSIFIHDSDMITGHPLEKIINGPAHHTLHHIYFTVNYGQYFTWADRAGNSYRHPDASLDPLLEIQMRENREEDERKKSD